MSKTKRRPTVILDAGYVSIKANDRWKSSKIIGLHGIKLFCVIITVLILFFISCFNLTVSHIVKEICFFHWIISVPYLDYVQTRLVTILQKWFESISLR